MSTSTINRGSQLSTISNAAYLHNPPEVVTTTGGTWTRVGDPFSTTSGFFGVAYHNSQTNEIAIGMRGTNGMSDLWADSTFLSGGWSQQFTDAAQFTAAIKRRTVGLRARYPDAKLITTGHSLGDGIAQVMSTMS